MLESRETSLILHRTKYFISYQHSIIWQHGSLYMLWIFSSQPVWVFLSWLVRQWLLLNHSSHWVNVQDRVMDRVCRKLSVNQNFAHELRTINYPLNLNSALKWRGWNPNIAFNILHSLVVYLSKARIFKVKRKAAHFLCTRCMFSGIWY